VVEEYLDPQPPCGRATAKVPALIQSFQDFVDTNIKTKEKQWFGPIRYY
jgi:hypothetical protein